MKKNSLRLIYTIVIAGCLIVSSSCKKMFEVKPEGQVDVANHYDNIYDANAAVIGIYGQLLEIADRYVVLNELRADLMRPTNNADQWLRQLNTHEVSEDNPWADPKPFYKIILNCNDAMSNFNKMLAQDKITAAEHQQRYSDVGAIRSWLYLQLGIHYGSVPYVTDPFASISDLKDENKYKKIPFTQLIDSLVSFMGDPARHLDPYSAASTVTGATNTSLITTVNSYWSATFFIDKHQLLGDLYLWQGNYTKASEKYKYVSELQYFLDTNPASQNRYNNRRPNFSFFTINYSDGNELRPVDDWSLMFRGDNRVTTQMTALSQEWIWTLPFDRNYLPVNPFVDLFSNQGGKYLLTASELALKKWDDQVQSNGFPYDRRGQLSVKTINNQLVIVKQLYHYLTETNGTWSPADILRKEGRWLIYRAGNLTLRFAEAANADNQAKVAYALVNRGIRSVFSADGEVTNLPAPYNLMGRNAPFRDAWYTQIGTRSRANLPALPEDLFTDPTKKNELEDIILEEAALELAFEGHRWGDLIRVALRRDDNNLIADKVFAKLTADGNPEAAAVRARLTDRMKWYLPFKL